MLQPITIHHIREKFEKENNKPLRHASDYTSLKVDIDKASQADISINTLKRLMGFLKGSENARPGTLDLIANYLGYKFWENYLVANNLPDDTNLKSKPILVDKPEVVISSQEFKVPASKVELLKEIQEAFTSIDKKVIASLDELLLLVFISNISNHDKSPNMVIKTITDLKGECQYYDWNSVIESCKEYLTKNPFLENSEDNEFNIYEYLIRFAEHTEIALVQNSFPEETIEAIAHTKYNIDTIYTYLSYALFFNYKSAISNGSLIIRIVQDLALAKPTLPKYYAYYEIIVPNRHFQVIEHLEYLVQPFFNTPEHFRQAFKSLNGLDFDTCYNYEKEKSNAKQIARNKLREERVEIDMRLATAPNQMKKSIFHLEEPPVLYLNEFKYSTDVYVRKWPLFIKRFDVSIESSGEPDEEVTLEKAHKALVAESKTYRLINETVTITKARKKLLSFIAALTGVVAIGLSYYKPDYAIVMGSVSVCSLLAFGYQAIALNRYQNDSYYWNALLWDYYYNIKGIEEKGVKLKG